MKKNYFVYFVCVYLLLFFVSCKNKSNNSKNNQTYLYPKYAKGFYILKESKPEDSYTLIIRNPSDTNNIISKILLKQTNLNSNNKLACLSTTHMAFCDRLGHISNIIGIPDSSFYLETDILKKVEKYGAKEITMAGGTKVELILSLNPNYLFTSEYQNIDYTTFESTGVKIIPVLEYLEIHPLGRMEWIRLFGFLLSCDSLANTIANSVEENYNNIVAKYKNDDNKPKILDVSEYSGYWYASGGKSYMAKLYEDAGYDYIWKDDQHNGSFPVSQEQAIEAGMKTEYWRHVTDCGKNTVIDENLIKAKNDYYYLFRSFKEGKIIVCNPLQSGYYIEGVIEPDIILKDLIFARENCMEENYLPKYYYRVVSKK